MGNLTDPRWIVAKGLGFLAIGILAAAILLLLAQSWQVACLLVLSVWAFCRFYYFAFYVIQNYVDGGYRYAGLLDFARYLLFYRSRSRNRSKLDHEPNSLPKDWL